MAKGYKRDWGDPTEGWYDTGEAEDWAIVRLRSFEYKRYKIVPHTNKRKIDIDLRCIRTTPWAPVDYGARKRIRWRSPEQLYQLIDGYFESCWGVLHDYKGRILEDKNGLPKEGMIEPLTLSGLAHACHIETHRLRKWNEGEINALGMPTDDDYEGPQYSDLLWVARQRIEKYAETRLYDKEGSFGGRFVLNAGFSWREGKEEAEIESIRKELELKERQLELRERQLQMAEDNPEPVTITIRRATPADVVESEEEEL